MKVLIEDIKYSKSKYANFLFFLLAKIHHKMIQTKGSKDERISIQIMSIIKKGYEGADGTKRKDYEISFNTSIVHALCIIFEYFLNIQEGDD